jgi:hypothetical protein
MQNLVQKNTVYTLQARTPHVLKSATSVFESATCQIIFREKTNYQSIISSTKEKTYGHYNHRRCTSLECATGVY